MKRLELLDYARFFAALWVVLFHYSFNGIANGKITSITHIAPLIEITKYGYLGVELFFMISGYVIFFSANNRSAANFAVSRAIRLMPCYWAAVILTSVFMLVWGLGSETISPTKIFINLSMLQSFVGVGHIDGVYWTLVYEITFYFAVFIILLAGLQHYLSAIFILWPFIMLLGVFLGMSEHPYMGGYFSYFSAGTLFALYQHKKNRLILIPLLVSAYLCVTFSIAQAELMTLSKKTYFSNTLSTGILLAFFLLFFSLQMPSVKNLKLPASKFLGALTYPIYLIHAHIGYILINKFADESNKLFVYSLIIAAVIISAFGLHWIVEVKLLRVWQTLFAWLIKKPIDAIQPRAITHQKHTPKAR